MDWISEGVIALISGMSAVFMILILISLMISGLGHFGKLEKKTVNKVVVDSHHSVDPTKAERDDEEEQRRIVAAITVALSMELGVSADQFVVRKFRRLER